LLILIAFQSWKKSLPGSVLFLDAHLLSKAATLQVVEEQGARTPGKRSLAMAAFARALRSIPTTICDNAGPTYLDPVFMNACGRKS